MRKGVRAVTRISEKGQVILPKALRERRGWTAGTEFLVEECPEGVFLRATGVEAADAVETFGKLKAPKAAITIEDMQEAMLEEARRRWAQTPGEGQ